MSMVDVFKSLGRADAIRLRERANGMTGTEIIASEHCIPRFDAQRDYTDCPVGTPVTDGGQVWQLLQPYNAAAHEGRPAELRALWGLCHTKDARRAKAWVAPCGTSGMYMQGECYKDAEGAVWRCKQDDVVYDAAAMPEMWEKVLA